MSPRKPVESGEATNRSSRDKCVQAARGFLEEGDSVVIGMFIVEVAVFFSSLTVYRLQTTQTRIQTRGRYGWTWRRSTRSPRGAFGSRRRL